ncbi:unnamed protein product [Taenia asiatica]|uniref:Uncharacterized protein n=1 Tax=Taenia asiatica TaxID=60517 RepID=A0A0R3W8D2_TAEAS|nr:unnamed protein product [Taenia asiatica]
MAQKSATERELFATFTEFIVPTDYLAITWLRTMKWINRLGARCYEELQQHDFTVQYRKETKHSNADALSSRPLSGEKNSGTVSTLFLSEPTRHQWTNTQNTDPDTARARKRWWSPPANAIGSLLLPLICARLVPNLQYLQQFQEASLNSNRTSASHAHGVPR